MSIHLYSIANDTADGSYSCGKLHNEVVALGLGSTLRYVAVSEDDSDELRIKFAGDISAGDKTSLDGAVTAHTTTATLEEHKNKKHMAVDGRTRELIAVGFSHASKQFSLSPAAQQKLAYMHSMKDSLTYPVKFNAIDDQDVLSIADATEMDAFCQAGVDAVRSHLDSGTALKDSVRAAADKAEVDAVVDSR